MKIGILTYHDGPNHGAFLQAWATLQTLRSAGYDAAIINYKNPHHHRKEGRFSLLSLRNPVFAWQMWQKQAAFKKAHHHFSLGPPISRSADLQDLHYDAVVIGSDVVWNYQLFGYDSVFFGEINADKRVSFSASFGTVRPEQAHPEGMAAALNRFDAIAVRDTNSREIVHKVCSREAVITLDPTLVYDFAGESKGKEKETPEPHLLVYSYRQKPDAIGYASAYAREHDLNINCVGYPPPMRGPRYSGRVDMSCGPFEWVERFAAAHTILTSTFHGVVFSLKFEKPFLFTSGDATYNRVSSLLDFSGIPHELELGREDETVLFQPDYREVTPRLQAAAKASRQWLLDALNH